MQHTQQRLSASLAAALLSGIMLLAGPGARATCGSSYCFLDRGTSEGQLVKGAFTVDVSYQFINQTDRRAGTHGIDEVLTPNISFEEGEIELDHHREIGTDNTLIAVNVGYGITDRVMLTVDLPLVNERQHDHFDEVGEPSEFFTRDDGSSGFGDLRVGVRFGLLTGKKHRFSGDLGIKFATGSFKERNSEGDINEPSIQPGTGSTDAIVGLRWSAQVKPHTLNTFVSATQKFNGENDLDYTFGDEMVISAGFLHQASDRWTWSLQVNARHTERDEFLDERVPSTGSDLVNLSPGLRFTTDRGTQIYAHYQYPVYQDVNEAQLTPRSGILVGLSRTF